ncbi:MAG TPA: zinc-binding dehydrogenase [Candidatus Limnocylindria bacterium]|nr:zinc-binding dehydrogenase [Candidatus Limnocylindria bacterium]
MIEELLARGEIGGRTVQINAAGDVECSSYPRPRIGPGQVLVRTVRSAISPGTELTFVGRQATNVHLHKAWDPELRLFRSGTPALSYPLTFGYRASGEVVESAVEEVPPGTRVWGNWRHTEFVLRDASVGGCVLPAGLSHDDGLDIGQMGPICVNAVAFADGRQEGQPVVVSGAGVIGLITAQVARASGAAEVYVVDRLAGRLAVAAELGLRTLHASAHVDVAYELKRSLGADALPVAWECTGSTRALHEAIRAVRRRGLVVAVGFYQGEAAGLLLGDEFHHNGVQLVCSQIGNVHPSWGLGRLRARTQELAVEGRLVLGGLPRLTLPVERAAEGFAALSQSQDVLQVALTYD